MERITKELPNGTWNIPGVDWNDIDGTLYGALSKLRDYERTGLSPTEAEHYKKMAEKLIGRDTALPVEVKGELAYCPACKESIRLIKHMEGICFCGKCGQRVRCDKEVQEDADKSERLTSPLPCTGVAEGTDKERF